MHLWLRAQNFFFLITYLSHILLSLISVEIYFIKLELEVIMILIHKWAEMVLPVYLCVMVTCIGFTNAQLKI